MQWELSARQLRGGMPFLTKKRGLRFLKRMLSVVRCPHPPKGGRLRPRAQLYFGQVFIIFAALAPPEGMFLRSSEGHFSANGGGSKLFGQLYLGYLAYLVGLSYLVSPPSCGHWT